MKKFLFLSAMLVCIKALHSTDLDDCAHLFSQAHTRMAQGDLATAIAHYRTILDSYPTNIQSLYNMGYALKMAGHIDEALTYYNEALRLDPTNGSAEYAKTLSYLTKGDFTHGWIGYEKYLQRIGYNAPKLRSFLANGTLPGKRILLIQQGGLGDTLNFIRFAKTLHDAGAYIIVLAPNALHDILKLCPYIDKLIAPGDSVPAHNDVASIMGLPAIMHAQESDMSALVPYLYDNPQITTYWKEQLACDQNFKIGICWQADCKNDASRLPIARRGVALQEFFRLTHIPGVSLYSLQQYDGVEQLDTVPQGITIHRFDDDFDHKRGRFIDTASVIQNMNLIITVDTALAHLAGGLGAEVWLLLPYSTDWRWIAGRTDSPWYPRMRIFKQQQPFAWEDVLMLVQEALLERVQLKVLVSD
jgi:tetratricopeptide (TPR) repeat protein